ncbi:MAG: 2-C-methyl-D-erythritol 4-phosphate cytidylyltransferase [Candidatus Omnitrophica bacterium]|nr:2-C-methyl-D-erythritol 4-phosphate cytidylyltransferase [Candidatus Omnitrophota bacterium]
MSLTCIVPAAGTGIRLGSRSDKPFVKLFGKPILAHTLLTLNKSESVTSIILSVRAKNVKKAASLAKKYRLKKVRFIVKGGRKRFDSVKNALSAAGKPDFVMVHDGARPFLSEDIIKRTFKAAKENGAAICAIPVTDTLKKVGRDNIIAMTENRKHFCQAQTPQIFRRDIISKAYCSRRASDATDDASLVEALGYKVKIVRGSPRNIKITTPEDLELAKALIKNKRCVRE